MWRGEPLAELLYEPFAQSEIARLEDARVGALEDRVEADLMLGRHRELVGELEELAERYPYRERLLEALMLALYRSGRQTDALEAYRNGRRVLQDRLGLEPGPQLRALEQRILTHAPELAEPSVGIRAPLASARRAMRGRLLVALGGAVLLAVAVAAGIVELSAGTAAVRITPNTVAVIDTRANRVTAAVAVGARPGAVTFAAGSVWVANRDDQTVSRVDPNTLATLRTLSLTAPPTGIAAAGGGVWVASSSSDPTFVSVSRIDPQFDTISPPVRIGNVVPNTPVALAAGSRGSVWVAPYSGELTRLSARSGRVLAELDPNAGPTGVAVGEGAAWVSDSNADTVTRVDATGLTTAIAVGHEPSGIAVGDGGVWVADTGDDAVVRIDPNTRAVTATIRVGAAPTGVAAGDSSVWVANSGDGTVTRIDPTSDKTSTIDVGGSPQAVTVAGHQAWVTVDQPAIPKTSLRTGGGTARLDQSYDVSSMDPAQAYDGLSWQLLYATCAKLLNYPDKPGLAGSVLVPEVAQSLPARSADGESYTFTIRRGFRFSPPSNEPVTAQTFKSTIERTLNPRMKNPVASEFRDIVGARAYMAGKATHISGVTARGDKLTVRLTAPAPDLPARLAQPFFCAVPPDTPIDPQGVHVIPMAGPYEISSYAPGQGIVLVRNPNYRGKRPHALDRFEVRLNIPGGRAVAQVQAGTADYALDGEVDSTDAAPLATRYGPGSPAARAGHQQYFVNVARQLDFLTLNTHRALFANPRMRQAVNYAIDRAALARLGHEGSLLPDQLADTYLPPNIPGYSNSRIYPPGRDLSKARALAAGHTGQTAVLYTCNAAPCDSQAQIIKTDLAAIGIHVETKTYPDQTVFTKLSTPGEPYDLAWVGWYADYPDPDAILNLLLETGQFLPPFGDAVYRARLAAAAQLSGPKRYLTYASLNIDLARTAAPWVAFGNADSHDCFSARIGCQTFGVYGIDLAALCIRPRR